LSLLKQLARGTGNSRRRFRVFTVFDWHGRVRWIKLATRERMETTEECQLFAPLYEEDFWILMVGIVTKENYGRSVFWLLCSICHPGNLWLRWK
jgi:hypothetical protein